MPPSDQVAVEKELCGHALDKRGLHFHACRVGTAPLRPHRSLTIGLGNLLKDAGSHVDIERVCPDLFQVVDGHGELRIREAVLDVVAVVHGSCRQWNLDVTVHSPLAASLQDAAFRPSAAAS